MTTRYSNEALYQLFRQCCGDLDAVSEKPGAPTSTELLELALQDRWWERLEGDGIIIDPQHSEAIKRWEASKVALIIGRIDRVLLPDLKRRRSGPRSQHAIDTDTLRIESPEFSRLAKTRIDLGKYLQLVLGEATSRGEVAGSELARKLARMSDSELRDFVKISATYGSDPEDLVAL